MFPMLKYYEKENAMMNRYDYRGSPGQLQRQCGMCGGVDYFPGDTSPLPENYALAMAYVPVQTEITTYDTAKAFCEGTLFPCLNKPFLRGACSK